MMFDNVGNPIDGWAIVVNQTKQPEIVSLHQCLGNGEEKMVLNEMAEGTDTTFVIKILSVV